MIRAAASVLAISLLLVGCQRTGQDSTAQPGSKPQPQQATAARTFQGVGVVERVDAEHLVVVIKHDKIEGFMDAMSMPYQVEGAALLAGLEPGDKINFTIRQGPGEIRVVRIQKIHYVLSQKFVARFFGGRSFSSDINLPPPAYADGRSRAFIFPC